MLLDGIYVLERKLKVSRARNDNKSTSNASAGRDASASVGASASDGRTTRTIHVGGIGDDINAGSINDELLEQFFGATGTVTAVRINPANRCAWLEYADDRGASDAIMYFDGEPFGSGVLRVSHSKTPIHSSSGFKGSVNQGSSSGRSRPSRFSQQPSHAVGGQFQHHQQHNQQQQQQQQQQHFPHHQQQHPPQYQQQPLYQNARPPPPIAAPQRLPPPPPGN